MRRIWAPVLAALLCASGSASAQDAGASKLEGALKKINARGSVIIGYRESSFPFSYLVEGKPIGYSIDLCLAVVDEIRREIDNADLKVAYELVTPDTRIAAVASGKVDLECGSTTSNRERQKEVAFSPIMYVSGTKLMVKRGSGLRSYRDFGGKTIVVTSGTTNEAALKALNEKGKLNINIVTGRDHEESYGMVAAGKADAFATDDVLLYGLIARHRADADFIVIGDFLSFDPYGLMFAKDDAHMAEVVRRAFETMAANRDLIEYYHRWFIRRTPTGEQIGLPMNAQLTEIFRTLGVAD
ncbi:amino acid ABC transporter substrate-binding protein [Terrarubrum flagellatum]|uniref:amino acid ABC transporter substrate-binding protein n=1 Tax=Terrirubrum flagellatum TaxID=2895980 RepID=UPI0031456B89